MNKCCGNCKFKCYDFVPFQYFCVNPKSKKAGSTIEHNGCCEEWTKQEEKAIA